MYNQYIASLISFRHEIDYIIDNEIEETLRGRGDSAKLKERLEYKLEDSQLLDGRYKKFETCERRN